MYDFQKYVHMYNCFDYSKKLSAKTGDEGIRTQRDDVRVLDSMFL